MVMSQLSQSKYMRLFKPFIPIYQRFSWTRIDVMPFLPQLAVTDSSQRRARLHKIFDPAVYAQRWRFAREGCDVSTCGIPEVELEASAFRDPWDKKLWLLHKKCST